MSLSVTGLEKIAPGVQRPVVISAEHVAYAYYGVGALSDVGVTAGPGQMVGLIGPNGSGKTTLLRAVYAALAPSAGLISIDDTPVASLKPREVALRLGVVVQEAARDVPIAVAEMVLLGRSPHQTSLQRYTIDDRRIAAGALQRVGARHLADRMYSALSGGEKQRVLIARSLALEKEHLLLDELTNHLDIRYQHEVLQLVRALGITTIVVLHDLDLAARYCDELVLLDRGRVVCAGTPDAVLRPEVLEAVYGIGVRGRVENGIVELSFSPFSAFRAVDDKMKATTGPSAATIPRLG